MASRTHCVIERRQSKFVITDRSANGTYLTIDGDRELILRREEAMLRNHGFIALGQSRATATELVEFSANRAKRNPWVSRTCSAAARRKPRCARRRRRSSAPASSPPARPTR
jgi:predicted component of type VI protein secretion system